jgi:hypothetical protein
MLRRLAAAAGGTALIALLGANIAFAGEVTGNGKSLHVEDSKWGTGLHSRSVCAFSGQEDLQFETGGSKGVPGHAQSWGQIPKSGDFGRDFLTSIGLNPGKACNPTIGEPGP